MKFVFPLLCAAIVSGTDECNYALEILALQDGSHTFRDHVNQWVQHASELMEKLHDEFGEYKIGLAAFTDKPIPFSGYGNYGAFHEGNSMLDYCYQMHVPLSTDIDQMKSGLQRLARNLGSGFDYPEGQLEAMLLAAYDLDVGFSPPEVTHDSATGRPIARIMLMITDDEGHLPGDAAANIRSYNAVRSYPNGYSEPSRGGFGSHEFYSSYAIRTEGNNPAMYAEMAALYAVLDAGEAGEGGGLTADQKARLQELIVHFGPEVFPEPEFPVHPGDNSVQDCTKTEYPSTTQVVEAMKAHNILPVFLVSGSYAEDFFTRQNNQYIVPSGLVSSVASFSSATLFDDIVKAISEVVAKECLATTTPAPPVVTEEVTVASQPPSPTEDLPGPSEETEEVPVVTEEVPEPTEEAAVSRPTGEGIPPPTEGEISEPTEEVLQTPTKEEGATENSEEENVSGAETTTTEPVVVVPPVQPPGEVVPEEDGSNIGTIAGATGGAVAGAAAVAGLLYKQFGMGMFGSGAPELANIDQVETPDTPVEREAMEEVTMDMFN
eukprot:Protomagalhaensia_wolfi_Nauph_80__6027@NODE_82_length_3886_cov_618_197037_g63_i0_p1_GENE_NODE_82_length_3886_cov_618_197037_g63_i0NODE_82_length_3886_cov_618_197037_g63_i0_p1_ORF_typecomplete_len549_score135_28Integrin_beta/PF00362_18/2_5e16Integrin_beta/PF00362_18/5_1e05Mucin15/PF15672_5/0_32ApoL/PF05461_11/0_99_NODE_82_length_3886_cov_618_197037_g63_i0811727